VLELRFQVSNQETDARFVSSCAIEGFYPAGARLLAVSSSEHTEALALKGVHNREWYTD
jgi:hypothetical protein